MPPCLPSCALIPPSSHRLAIQLPSIGVAQEFISFKNVTMESDKYICIRETGAQNTVVIVDMTTPQSPARRQISADSALMCPDKKVIALKAVAAGTAGDNLQVQCAVGSRGRHARTSPSPSTLFLHGPFTSLTVVSFAAA